MLEDKYFPSGFFTYWHLDTGGIHKLVLRTADIKKIEEQMNWNIFQARNDGLQRYIFLDAPKEAKMSKEGWHFVKDENDKTYKWMLSWAFKYDVYLKLGTNVSLLHSVSIKHTILN